MNIAQKDIDNVKRAINEIAWLNSGHADVKVPIDNSRLLEDLYDLQLRMELGLMELQTSTGVE